MEKPEPKIQERVEKVSLTEEQIREAERKAAEEEKKVVNNSDI